MDLPPLPAKSVTSPLPPLPSPKEPLSSPLPPLAVSPKTPLPPLYSPSLGSPNPPPPKLTDTLPSMRKTVTDQTVVKIPLAQQVEEFGKQGVLEAKDEDLVVKFPPLSSPEPVAQSPLPPLPPVVASPGASPSFVGEGAIEKETDFSTLESVKLEAQSGPETRREAAFQKDVQEEVGPTVPIATLPSLKDVAPISSLTIPPVSPVPMASPGVDLPPLSQTTALPPLSLPKEKEEEEEIIVKKIPSKEVNLPTTKRKAAAAIRIPKLKVSGQKPKQQKLYVPPVGGQIPLPMESTMEPTIPVTSPTPTTQKVKRARVGEKNVMENIKNIDPSRLNPGKTKKGDKTYTVAELKVIAGSLNLSKTGNKRQLVERIRTKIKSLLPGVIE